VKIGDLKNRIGRLEKRFDMKQSCIRVVVRGVTQEFALGLDQCIPIVDESRPARTGIKTMNLLNVPCNLNTNQLQCYLRQHADEICSSAGIGAG